MYDVQVPVQELKILIGKCGVKKFYELNYHELEGPHDTHKIPLEKYLDEIPLSYGNKVTEIFLVVSPGENVSLARKLIERIAFKETEIKVFPDQERFSFLKDVIHVKNFLCFILPAENDTEGQSMSLSHAEILEVSKEWREYKEEEEKKGNECNIIPDDQCDEDYGFYKVSTLPVKELVQ